MRAALILASALALGACNMAADAQGGDEPAGSREMAQRSYQVGDFNAVALGGHHNVVVTVGPAVSVRAEGEVRELDRLEIKVEDGSLEIGTKRDKRWKHGWRNSKPVTVYVTVPALRAAAIGGSGDMRIDRVEGDRFEAAIGGSGNMDIAQMRVGEAGFSIAGSGNIQAVGSAGKSDVSIAGSGDVNVSAVESRTTSVSIVGSGDVSARAMETANVSIMGSGDVSISGPAKCSVSKMGSGDVRCEG